MADMVEGRKMPFSIQINEKDFIILGKVKVCVYSKSTQGCGLTCAKCMPG